MADTARRANRLMMANAQASRHVTWTFEHELQDNRITAVLSLQGLLGRISQHVTRKPRGWN